MITNKKSIETKLFLNIKTPDAVKFHYFKDSAQESDESCRIF